MELGLTRLTGVLSPRCQRAQPLCPLSHHPWLHKLPQLELSSSPGPRQAPFAALAGLDTRPLHTLPGLLLFSPNSKVLPAVPGSRLLAEAIGPDSPVLTWQSQSRMHEWPTKPSWMGE